MAPRNISPPALRYQWTEGYATGAPHRVQVGKFILAVWRSRSFGFEWSVLRGTQWDHRLGASGKSATRLGAKRMAEAVLDLLVETHKLIELATDPAMLEPEQTQIPISIQLHQNPKDNA